MCAHSALYTASTHVVGGGGLGRVDTEWILNGAPEQNNKSENKNSENYGSENLKIPKEY